MSHRLFSDADRFVNSSLLLLATSAISCAGHAAQAEAEAEAVVPGGPSNTHTRTYSTDADVYFQQCQRIPMPKISHDYLDLMIHRGEETTSFRAGDSSDSDGGTTQESNKKILVIGDVHGCLNELKSLVPKAKDNNDNKGFAAVVLVGDLGNKGPYSAEVINYVRSQRNWFSVRGNHDNFALAAALGDEKRKGQKDYEWVYSLSDDDVEWLSNLPYTITIPRSVLEDTSPASASIPQNDIIVVHAGLIPGICLDDQDIQTMTTIRNVAEIKFSSDPVVGGYRYVYRYYKNEPSSTADIGNPQAWAKVWNGPQELIFGHDARRGLQNENYAIGLDSGACYGKKLTGIILPEKVFVSVDAEKIHCSIK